MYFQKRWEDRGMTDRQKHTFHGTTTQHPGPIKQEEIIIVAEEVVFTQTLALLPPTS